MEFLSWSWRERGGGLVRKARLFGTDISFPPTSLELRRYLSTTVHVVLTSVVGTFYTFYTHDYPTSPSILYSLSISIELWFDPARICNPAPKWLSPSTGSQGFMFNNNILGSLSNSAIMGRGKNPSGEKEGNSLHNWTYIPQHSPHHLEVNPKYSLVSPLSPRLLSSMTKIT